MRRTPPHNIRTTHVWTETSKERLLLTVSGRERVNLNAALNARCPNQVHLDETECVNAHSTQRLSEKLLIAHPEGPVHIVCDNARYYKTRPSPPGWPTPRAGLFAPLFTQPSAVSKSV